MNRIKSFVLSFLGHFYVPQFLQQHKEPQLLHFSDTPASIYRGIRKLIEEIKPSVIIHTGDLVDQIKLEYMPFRYEEYEKQALELLEILRNSGADVYIILGNHDDHRIKEFLLEKDTITIIDHEVLVPFGFGKVAMGHDLNVFDLSGADYYLYGHTFKKPSTKRSSHNKKVLNGLHHAHSIGMKTGHVTKLSYPMGTNDQRFGTRKRGL